VKLKRNKIFYILYILSFSIVIAFISKNSLFKNHKNYTNIILIAIDTLRADHLGCYGYPRTTSPNIDQLAHDSIIFENAFAQSPWTLPSFSSMFTSLYPSQHKAGLINKKLEDDYLTLAEILSQNGYYTIGFTGGAYLSKEFGLSQGFDIFYEYNSPQSNDIENVIQHAIKWLKEKRKDKFFLFVHSYQPHSPYWPPTDFDIFFKSYTGRITGDIWKDIGIVPEKLESRFKTLSKIDRDRLISLYDGDILYTDYWIGRLLTTLQDLGLYNNSLIIFTSDHGEEFNEHGAWEHGHSLYNELIHVPLILKLPGLKLRGTKSKRIAQLIDILPTICEIANLKINFSIQGESLLAKSSEKNIAYSQSFPVPNLLAVVEGDTKVIFNFDNAKCEIYNIEEDRYEKFNIFSEKKFEYYKLKLKIYPLLEIKKNIFSLDKSEVSEEIWEKLKQLGYIK